MNQSLRAQTPPPAARRNALTRVLAGALLLALLSAGGAPVSLAVPRPVLASNATPAPTVTSLYPFSALGSQDDNHDGVYPVAALTVGPGGSLYGVTAAGGAAGAGTLFEVGPTGAGFTSLHSFSPDDDGAAPAGTLLLGAGGFLYGTTGDAGPGGGGTVFKIAPDGSGFAVLHAFDADSGGPEAGLTSGGDGLLYGTTSGGQTGMGIVFKIAPNGTGFTVLHRFTGGDTPLGAILVGTGGVLYGTTSAGGDSGAGSIFTVRTNGAGYDLLYSFTGGADGANPQAGLTAGGNGFLYGTTSDSQLADGHGTVFKIGLDGTGFATLYRFTGGLDGDSPYASVTLGPDGLLYGTTFAGGADDAGTVFAIMPDGSRFATEASLSGTGGDGGGSCAGLTLGLDGRWYGTAYEGGPNGSGALFVYTPPVRRGHKIRVTTPTPRGPLHAGTSSTARPPSVPTASPTTGGSGTGPAKSGR